MFVAEKAWKHTHRHANNNSKNICLYIVLLLCFFSTMRGKCKTARIPVYVREQNAKICLYISIFNLLENRTSNLNLIDRVMNRYLERNDHGPERNDRIPTFCRTPIEELH